MKILKAPEEFSTIVRCVQLNDGSGRGWGKPEDYCDAMLSVDAKDICYRDWREFRESRVHRDYGVICPCCHSFIQLPTRSIPPMVRSNAISYTTMKAIAVAKQVVK